ncbi:hypothetical protein PFNF54_02684 [Plasmodium falciparum NF54]|uniref:Erythrocyte membrane protein 1 n=1 Tax=Plasmodium falciparum (isolate NF54) TaxID=5843 RepID=W7K594_PLAFO|nr:hypothetical protein PFNF54_02684 [Plasmodium falciparum NF54]
MAAQSSGGGGGCGEEDKDAKYMFDRIGKEVHDEVKNAANVFKDYLKGNLTISTIFGEETVAFTDPCELIKEKRDELLAARGDPCGKGKEHRFSKERGAECDDNKIEGNVRSKGKGGKSAGACAPYRRLSLCNKNFPNMNSKDSLKAKNDLLVDVCYAAKYEAESLIPYHDQYKLTYGDSQICTVLARSFADIGDIVRGKDLFLGHNQRKKKLEERLEQMFKNITHSNAAKLSVLSSKEIREYWWALNRDQVWKALTCDEENKLGGNAYFHATCSERNGGCSQAHEKCRCPMTSDGKPNDQVPTYFDYVPQYLRWFEEWAEDFCRKKKIYVDIVKKYCRGERDGEKYCSLNGCDCTKTVRARGKLRYGNRCTDCLFACHRYENWIDNQRKQFLKQRNKYTEEINGTSTSSRTRRSARGGSDHKGYEKIFYEKLEGEYRTVDGFLELLNKEKACQEVKDSEGGKINFSEKHSGNSNDETKGTFYRSEYCQPCPYCGVRKTKGNQWENKSKNDQCNIKLYRPNPGESGTPIEILKSGEGETEIENKLNAFCAQTKNGSVVGGGSGGGNSDSKELYDEWQCYEFKQLTTDGQEDDDDEDYDKDVRTGGGLCILEKKKEEGEAKSQNEPDEIQKTYNDFFYYWVAHMLKDSIHWRTKKLDKCINNTNKSKACKNSNKCNNDCGCFQKWVDQKKEKEWDAIKQQFRKQKDIGDETNCDPIVTLEGVLQIEFLKGDSEDSSEEKSENSLDAKEIQHLRQMLKQAGVAIGLDAFVALRGRCTEGGADSQNKTTIDKLLDEEAKEAKDCQSKHKDPCPKPQDGVAGRSAEHPEEQEEEEEDDDEEIEEKSEENDEESEKTVEDKETEAENVAEVPPTTQDNAEKPCDIVAELFKNPDPLKQACPTKYGSKAPTSWKCIPTKPNSDSSTTGGGSDTGVPTTKSGATGKSGGSDTGSVCIPPRRRKLYVGELTKWAESKQVAQAQTTDTQTQVDAASTSTSQTSLLRDAFIQSAAVETFFLWHRYKKEWELRQKEAEQGQSGLPGIGVPGAGIPVVPGAGIPGVVGANGLSQPVLGVDNDNPQTSLQNGTIPPDFLRQMFYTLGDYRDILFSGSNDTTSGSKDTSSGSNDNLKHIVLNAGGDQKSKDEMQTIQTAISSYFSNSGKPSTSVTPVTQPSGTTPQALWSKYAESIWNGMVCALTYRDSGDKGGKPQKVEAANGKLFQQLKDKYGEYDKVKLEEEDSENQAKGSSSQHPENPSTTSENKPTHLTDFISRPPYFRYLEEWGQNFCKKRTEMLGKIKDNCTEDGGKTKKCSGDGHDCTDGKRRYNNMFDDLDCRPCYEQCRKYRKWIDIKFVEYQNQKNKYGEEHEKLKTNSNGDNNCCTEIKEKTSAADFLKALKHCKDGQTGGEKNKTHFENPETTFGPLDYCKTCPPNKVSCNVIRGRSGGRNGCNVKDNEDKWKEVFDGISGNGGKSSTIEVEMIDRRGPYMKEYMKENSKNPFKTSRLFKGIRKEQWECKVTNDDMHICKLDQFKENINLNPYTTFKVLLHYWLEDFLYGYYISKKKIEKCTQKEKNACDEETKKNCVCVKTWVEQKKKEWKEIKKHFKNREQKYGQGNDIKSKVKMFLETLIPLMDLVNNKGKHESLDAFLKSYECKCAESSGKKGGKENNIVLCLLDMLEKKATPCLSSTSDSSETPCENTPTTLDDDDPLEEENPVIHPQICGDIPTTKETVDEDACKRAEEPPKEPAPTGPKKPAPTAGGEEDQTEKDTEVNPLAPAPADETFDPTILQTTIPLGIALALGSIAFLFLKKKMKKMKKRKKEYKKKIYYNNKKRDFNNNKN